jgi:hypothetical protein
VQIKSRERKSDLAQIYQSITELLLVPDIKSQIDAIKQSRLTMLKNEEQHIPKPSRSTGILHQMTEQSSDT